jgi:membrane protease YdiL (CAAX protease family)
MASAIPVNPVTRRRPAPSASAALAFVKRHPVLTYFVLVFVVSIGGVLAVIGASGIPVPATPERFARLMPVAIPIMLLGPPVAAVLLTGVVAGRSSLRDLRARLLRWRVDGRWYAVALLTAPLLYTLLLSALSLLSPEFVPGIVATDDKVSLLLTGLAVGVVGGLVEELGWTGFAIPRLRRRHGVVATGLIVGVLWGAWHVPITLWGTGDGSGALAPLLFLPPFLFYVGVLPPYRVLMIWIHDRTESVLVAMVMHASLIASSLFVLQPLARGVELSAYYIVLTTALWVLAAVVNVTAGRHLSRNGGGA